MLYLSYGSYKSVQYEWTDQVPSHWLDKRFRFLLLDGYDGLKIGPFGSQIKSEELTNEGYKVYGQENVINNDFTLGHRYLDEDKFNELTVYEIIPGDLLITMMGTSGKCRIAPDDMQQGIMDSHLIRLRATDEILTEYSRYLIDESKYIKCQIDLLGKGSIMHGLNSSIIKSLLFHVPPVEEQKKIVQFLDYKTQQIDHLIEKKKKLVEKLEEKRIAVITQTVTKGLDKNTKLKSSGVDWLGDVPEHWEMTRFRFLLNDGYEGLKIGPFGSQIKSEELTNEGYKVYGQENVINNNFKLGHRFLDEQKFDELKVYEIFPGDILITMMGSSGNCQLAPKNLMQGIMDSHLIRLRTNCKMSAEFSKLLIDEAHYVKHQMMLLGKGSIMHGLNSSIIKSLNFCVPPIDEQNEILQFLSIELGHVDELKKAAERTINRLEEYRSAIITSAVTGKIDIRDVDIPKEIA